jgi:hypothetical protein
VYGLLPPGENPIAVYNNNNNNNKKPSASNEDVEIEESGRS